ncbi:hypothetical protein [Bacillus massiliglaciei]|uniref:hypothetical protein n=1 Tax=Bacillus massiliglaciei TaxID=1816693 RepID=UPI000DA62827|nr:hypothetical protein [Bacillus massiliglaciei]
MSKKYSININSNRKVIEMYVAGSFTPADAQAFMSDYSRTVSSIDAPSYTLEVDCTEMNVVTPKMIPELEGSYQLYKQSGFHKVIFKIKKSTILKMQLSRLARNTGLTQAEVIKI